MPTTGIAYGVAVGLLYGVSSLAVKGVSGLVTRNVAEATRGLAASPYPYLLAVTGTAGLVLSQTALQRCRASLIVPVCTTVACVFAVVAGTFAFGEPLPQAPERLGLRLSGTGLAVIVLLALPRPDRSTPAERTPLPPSEPCTPTTHCCRSAPARSTMARSPCWRRAPSTTLG